MNVMSRVSHSVLVMLDTTRDARSNILSTALLHGVSSRRIHFIPMVASTATHLTALITDLTCMIIFC